MLDIYTWRTTHAEAFIGNFKSESYRFNAQSVQTRALVEEHLHNLRVYQAREKASKACAWVRNFCIIGTLGLRIAHHQSSKNMLPLAMLSAIAATVAFVVEKMLNFSLAPPLFDDSMGDDDRVLAIARYGLPRVVRAPDPEEFGVEEYQLICTKLLEDNKLGALVYVIATAPKESAINSRDSKDKVSCRLALQKEAFQSATSYMEANLFFDNAFMFDNDFLRRCFKEGNPYKLRVLVEAKKDITKTKIGPNEETAFELTFQSYVSRSSTGCKEECLRNALTAFGYSNKQIKSVLNKKNLLDRDSALRGLGIDVKGYISKFKDD